MKITYRAFVYNGHKYYVGRKIRKYAHQAIARSLKTLKLRLKAM